MSKQHVEVLLVNNEFQNKKDVIAFRNSES